MYPIHGKDWEGSIVELPEIECVAETAEVVQEKLPDILHDILVAKEAAWDKQIKEDIEAGRLDPLIQEAIQDYKTEEKIHGTNQDCRYSG